MVAGSSAIIDNVLWWRKYLTIQGLSDIMINLLWWRKCLMVEVSSIILGTVLWWWKCLIAEGRSDLIGNVFWWRKCSMGGRNVLRVRENVMAKGMSFSWRDTHSALQSGGNHALAPLPTPQRAPLLRYCRLVLVLLSTHFIIVIGVFFTGQTLH